MNQGIELVSMITGEKLIFTGIKGMCYMCDKKCDDELFCHSYCVQKRVNQIKGIINKKQNLLSNTNDINKLVKVERVQ